MKSQCCPRSWGRLVWSRLYQSSQSRTLFQSASSFCIPATQATQGHRVLAFSLDGGSQEMLEFVVGDQET